MEKNATLFTVKVMVMKDKELIQLLTNITEWSSFKEHPIGKQAQRALDLLLPKTEWECSISDGKLVLL